MNLRLPMVHVPVRRSREGFMLVSHYNNLGYYSEGTLNSYFTHSVDMAQVQTVRYYPGGMPTGVNTNPANTSEPLGVPQYITNRGYFGHSQEMRVGVPRLSDIFEIAQRRSVLYLEVKDLGSSYLYPDTRPGIPQDPTPPPLNEAPAPLLSFIHLNEQITQFGVGKSVIVGSQLPITLDANDRQGILDGLLLAKNSGVATAVHFTSVAEMTASPPELLTTYLGATWAFFSYDLVDNNAAQIKTYKDAGIQCMLHSAHRAHHYDMLSKADFGAGGLKGAVCFDPVYVGGPQNNWEYRVLDQTWDWGTPDYGRHSGWSSIGIPGQRDHLRGYVAPGAPFEICIDPDVVPPGESTATTGVNIQTAYYVLMGEECPIAYPQYDIDFTVRWDSGNPFQGSRYMGCAFGVEEDRHFKDWIRCDQYSKGYVFFLTKDGSFVFLRYDGIPYPPEGDPSVLPPYQYGLVWPSGYTPQDHTNYSMKVRVRNDRLILGPGNETEGGTNTRTFTATTPAGAGGTVPEGTLYRGPFFYLGRHFWNTGDAVVTRWGNLKITQAP
jgi:hypothetical protein